MEDRDKSHERIPKNYITPSPSLNGDFPVSQNQFGINPSMQNSSSRSFVSQNHPFQNYAHQNRSLTSGSNDFVSPTTLNHSQNQSFGSLHPTESLEAAMSRLQLSSDIPSVNYTPYFGAESFDVGSSSSSSYNQQQLQRWMRVDSASRQQLGFPARTPSPTLWNLLHGHLPSNRSPFFSHLQSGNPQNETVVANRNWGSSVNNISRNLFPLQHPRPFASIEDVRGRVVLAAKNEYGCLFLESMLDEGRPEETKLILWELKDHLHELMKDQYGNRLVQKVFECCEMTSILPFVIRDEHKLKNVCIHPIGNWAILELLKQLRTEEETIAVMWALKPITVTLTKNEIGGHVIRHCLRFLPPVLTRPILDEVADSFIDIATHSKGCTFVQKCLPVVNEEAMQQLVRQTVLCASILADHPFGNYVLQCIVKLKEPLVNSTIVAHLQGKYVQLSMNKFASNVLETLLACSEEIDVARIVQEIMYSDEFLNVLRDPYGNFVAQKALRFTKRAMQSQLKRRIQFHARDLQSHLHGYRVLEFLKHHRYAA